MMRPSGRRLYRQPVGTSGPAFRPSVEDPLTVRSRAYVPGATQPLRRGGPVPDIEAHITGTVWKIECKVGDKVAEGDTVVILESMKMEMPVEAEDEGTVKEILCEEGQAVNEGDTLVRLE
jgi:acetyl-CoA carboxylase biotin carboxyl carrier protein